MAASNGHIDIAEYLVMECKVPVEPAAQVRKHDVWVPITGARDPFQFTSMTASSPVIVNWVVMISVVCITLNNLSLASLTRIKRKSFF